VKTSSLLLGGVRLSIAALAAIALLAACTPRDEVAIGYQDNVLVFVSCDEVQAEQVHVRVRSGASDWEVYWTAEGTVESSPNDPIDVVAPPEELSVLEFYPERWANATRVSVELFSMTGLGDLGDPTGIGVATDDIPTTGWLRADGSTGQLPCG
jgi:hypothetical protein